MAKLRVAAAQIACRPGDVSANCDTHLAVLDEARGAGLDLVAFPELSLTDYLSEPDCAALAMPADDPVLARLAAAAGPVAASVGFIERAPDGRRHNAQALLAGGAVRAVHRKINLPGYGRLTETRHYAPGAALALTDVAGWPAATLVCADSWNPALPWLAALAGAELLILPVASARGAVDGAFDNPAGWAVNLAHTALTYGLPTLFANHCGRRGGLDFWGGSRILDADGRVLAQAGEAPGLVVAELDRDRGRRARARLPTAATATPALVHRLLGDLLAARPDL